MSISYRRPGQPAEPAGRTVGGRPAPPRPPHGPIGRVSPLTRQEVASAQLAALGTRERFGLPNLRRNICPHFFVTGPRGPITIQAPHMIKALMRHDATVSRCQLRGGVHLDGGYVTDICLSSRFNHCVFYEDELTGR